MAVYGFNSRTIAERLRTIADRHRTQWDKPQPPAQGPVVLPNQAMHGSGWYCLTTEKIPKASPSVLGTGKATILYINADGLLGPLLDSTGAEVEVTVYNDSQTLEFDIGKKVYCISLYGKPLISPGVPADDLCEFICKECNLFAVEDPACGTEPYDCNSDVCTPTVSIGGVSVVNCQVCDSWNVGTYGPGVLQFPCGWLISSVNDPCDFEPMKIAINIYDLGGSVGLEVKLNEENNTTGFQVVWYEEFPSLEKEVPYTLTLQSTAATNFECDWGISEASVTFGNCAPAATTTARTIAPVQTSQIGTNFKKINRSILKGCGCQYGDAVAMLNQSPEHVEKNLDRIVQSLLTSFKKSKQKTVRDLSAETIRMMIAEAVAYTAKQK